MVHTGGPATFAITLEPHISLYKAWSIHLHGETSAQCIMHLMWWPFCDIGNPTCWHEKIWKRETKNLNMVICSSLGAGSRCPMVGNYSIKSCPVDRLGQYLNSACSHHSQFTSVQLSLAQLNSEQLLVSLYDFSAHCHIASRSVFMWSLGIIIRNIYWIKVMQVLNHFGIEISFCWLLSIWIN